MIIQLFDRILFQPSNDTLVSKTCIYGCLVVDMESL